jgi:hypothetical protein
LEEILREKEELGILWKKRIVQSKEYMEKGEWRYLESVWDKKEPDRLLKQGRPIHPEIPSSLPPLALYETNTHTEETFSIASHQGLGRDQDGVGLWRVAFPSAAFLQDGCAVMDV